MNQNDLLELMHSLLGGGGLPGFIAQKQGGQNPMPGSPFLAFLQQLQQQPGQQESAPSSTIEAISGRR